MFNPGLEDAFPLVLLGLTNMNYLAVLVPHDRQDDVASIGNAAPEEDLFVSAEYVEQELFHFFLLRVHEHHSASQLLGKVVAPFVYKTNHSSLPDLLLV